MNALIAQAAVLSAFFLVVTSCKKPGEKNGSSDGNPPHEMELSDMPGVTKTDGTGYFSYFSGNAKDVSPATKSSILLGGGGDYPDEAMQWFSDRAGRGDIVALRANDSTYYNEIFMKMGANSVRTFVMTSQEGAEQSEVLDALNKAEGIFFAGGDQSFYVNYLKHTKVAAAVNAAAMRGAPIGGTSAGLAILGQFVYSAQYNSLTSTDALKDPFHHDMTLDKDFIALPALTGAITDSHFAARNRMGRSIAFMARLNKAQWHPAAHVVAIDEDVAMAVDENGVGSMFTTGNYAYILTPTRDPAVCQESTPLTMEGVEVYKLGKDAKFDFKTWTGSGGSSYSVNVKDGVLSSPSGAVY